MSLKFKRRWGGSKVDAQTAGDELQRIYGETGKLTAEIVVDAARPDDAPLHPEFEWDDSIAGEHWRYEQARKLVRCVHVMDDATEKDLGCAFVRVDAVFDEDSGEESAYVPTSVAVADQDMFRVALRNLQRHLAQAERSLSDLEAAAAREGKKKWQTRAVARAGQGIRSASEALREAAAAE